jgi:hypothetical protein
MSTFRLSRPTMPLSEYDRYCTNRDWCPDLDFVGGEPAGERSGVS